MELRQRLGEIIDEVRLKLETVVIERAGKPVARLVPYAEEPNNMERKRRRMEKLMSCYGAASHNRRSSDADQWLRQERDAWDDREQPARRG
jgi:prevent-host-death family protein